MQLKVERRRSGELTRVAVSDPVFASRTLLFDHLSEILPSVGRLYTISLFHRGKLFWRSALAVDLERCGCGIIELRIRVRCMLIFLFLLQFHSTRAIMKTNVVLLRSTKILSGLIALKLCVL